MNTSLTTQLVPDNERLQELLAGEALGDLTQEERTELESLAASAPVFDRACMERAAAELALLTERLEIPAALSHKLREQAAGPAPLPMEPQTELKPQPTATGSSSSDSRPSLLALSGWLAAAAALAAAFVIAVVNPATVEPVLTADQQLAAFREAPPTDLVEIDWTLPMPEDPAVANGLTGTVVWSDERQEGYMVFEGLASNDPTVEQYQLWIFDAERSADHPVDGGVFDIPADQDRVVVKITSKIRVFDASAFAVTVEPPGGVVVSDRARIPALAAVPAS